MYLIDLVSPDTSSCSIGIGIVHGKVVFSHPVDECFSFRQGKLLYQPMDILASHLVATTVSFCQNLGLYP